MLPSHWKLLFDSSVIARVVRRMSLEIIERSSDLGELALVGVRTGGEHLAKRIQDHIFEYEKILVARGTVDITLYRDDVLAANTHPTLVSTDLPFQVTNSKVILVDDLLFTGRTIRSAMDAVVDFGRPSRIELACLVDRGHHEFPIQPDYIGRIIPTRIDESIKVKLKELGGEDAIYLVPQKEAR